MTEPSGWIYVNGWDEFQHYRDRRPTWIKLYLDLLDNEDFLDLTLAQRGVLVGIWMVVGRTGNGRLHASSKSLRRAIQPPSKGDAAAIGRTIERLIQAGFIEVRASKAVSNRYQPASPDLREEKEKEERARASSANGAAPRAQKKKRPSGDFYIAQLDPIYREATKEMP